MTNNLLFFLTKYSDYFYDGSIEHRNEGMIIWAESAELLPEWYWDRKTIPLSKRNTISGKLSQTYLISAGKQNKCLDQDLPYAPDSLIDPFPGSQKLRDRMANKSPISHQRANL